MYKIAAVGDRDSISGFASLGLATFEVKGREDSEHIIDKLADSGFAVIYVTELVASFIPDTLERYRASAIPAIIPIPGVTGNTGAGMRDVHLSVEKAVGSDILSDNNGGKNE